MDNNDISQQVRWGTVDHLFRSSDDARAHMEHVHSLLDAGADVNARDKDGVTPLHDACFHGYTDTARLLLDAGADVNVRDKWGNTPLDLADATYRKHKREELLDLFREYAPEAVKEAI